MSIVTFVNTLLASIPRKIKATLDDDVYTPHHIAERDLDDPMLALVGDDTVTGSLAWHLSAIKDQTDTLEPLLAAIKLVAESTNAVQTFQSYPGTTYTANGTYSPVAGAGSMGGIFVAAKGATGNTLDVYDSLTATGTKLIDGLDLVNAPIGWMAFPKSFGTGLTLVLASGTCAKISVLWKAS